MFNYKGIGFLQEDKDTRSAMRLMCFLTLLFAFFITWLIVSSHLDAGTEITKFELVLILILYTAAFAPKAIQKFAEVQTEKLSVKNG